MQILGFSDHVPYPAFPDPAYYSFFRMRPEQTTDYCNSILQLKEEYKTDIDIRLGFEAEYYPELFEDLLAFLKDYPYEYLILGQHCVGKEYDNPWWSSHPTDNADILRRYVDQTIEGMQTGAYSYLCHPDLFHFTGDDTIYGNEMKRICETALQLDMPLECNLLGFRAMRNYPDPRFFRLAGEYGCKVILGIDAHSPAEIDHPRNAGIHQFLADCGVTNIVEDFK
jgi:histidinol-phosphatase (PHP family)